MGTMGLRKNECGKHILFDDGRSVDTFGVGSHGMPVLCEKVSAYYAGSNATASLSIERTSNGFFLHRHPILHVGHPRLHGEFYCQGTTFGRASPSSFDYRYCLRAGREGRASETA